MAGFVPDIENAHCTYTFSMEERYAIRRQLLAWYDQHSRALPWREPPNRGAQQGRGDQAAAAVVAAVAATVGTAIARGKGKRAAPVTQTGGKGAAARGGSSGIDDAATAAPDDSTDDSIDGGGSAAPAAISRVAVDAGKVSSSDERQQRRAYAVWVSEVMLQQTRVATVIAYFHRWMEKWPSVDKLAAATVEEVNSVWAGLGYYRRARYLLEGAQYVMSSCGGQMPSDVTGLLRVPGVGAYTAGAIASIAFDVCAPLVDGNVVRVLSRLRAIPLNPKLGSTAKLHWALATELVEGLKTRPGDFNQALMELGAVLCTVTSPGCNRCPVADHCRALALEAASAGTVATTPAAMSTQEAAVVMGRAAAKEGLGGVLALGDAVRGGKQRRGRVKADQASLPTEPQVIDTACDVRQPAAPSALGGGAGAEGSATTMVATVRVTDFPAKVPKAAARDEDVDVFVVELVMANWAAAGATAANGQSGASGPGLGHGSGDGSGHAKLGEVPPATGRRAADEKPVLASAQSVSRGRAPKRRKRADDQPASSLPMGTDEMSGKRQPPILGVPAAACNLSAKPPLAAGIPPPASTSALPSMRPSSPRRSWFLLVKRPESGLLAGLWEFPAIVVGGPTPSRADDLAADGPMDAPPGADAGDARRVGKRASEDAGHSRSKSAKARNTAKGEAYCGEDAETARVVIARASDSASDASIGGKVGIDGLLWRWLGVRLVQHSADGRMPPGAVSCEDEHVLEDKDTETNARLLAAAAAGDAATPTCPGGDGVEAAPLRRGNAGVGTREHARVGTRGRASLLANATGPAEPPECPDVIAGKQPGALPAADGSRPRRAASMSKAAKDVAALPTMAASKRKGAASGRAELATVAGCVAEPSMRKGDGGQVNGGRVWPVASHRDLGTILHIFSHVRHRMRVQWLRLSCVADPDVVRGDVTGLDGTKLQWVAAEELEARSATLSSGMKKVYALLAAAQASEGC